MKKQTSNITASIFWDRTKDSLPKNFTGHIKYKKVMTTLNMLFTEWKNVEKSYLCDIENLKTENDALEAEIELLNHQLTQRNNLVYLNASLRKELHHYKYASSIPVDGQPLFPTQEKRTNTARSAQIIQFPHTIALSK